MPEEAHVHGSVLPRPVPAADRPDESALLSGSLRPAWWHEPC